MLWDSKKIRKGILIVIAIEVSFVLISMLDRTIGFFVYWGITALFLCWWWRYYNECVNILKSKIDLTTEK